MDKHRRRSAVLESRRGLGERARADAASAITSHVLASPEFGHVGPGDVVAAYVSFGTEPSTSALLTELAERAVEVIVPVIQPDRGLDWRSVGAGGSGPESGRTLGRAAIGTARAVIVPALSCALDGSRLGRGGGSYDRALTYVAGDTPVCALLYADELVASLPVEPHDRKVTMVALPTGVVRF